MSTLQEKIIQGLLYEAYECGPEETAIEMENGGVSHKSPYKK